MLPYEQMKAMADQKRAGYEAQAERHRSLGDRDGSGRIDRLVAAGRIGIARSGLGRIGDVMSGREVRPAV